MEISRFYRISSICRASDGIVLARCCSQGRKDNLMTKKVKNDVTVGSFCVPPYHLDGKNTAIKSKGTKELKRGFIGKYNSTLEERIKRTPKENTIRGMWTGDRGESWYIPIDKSIIDILHVFELDGILYKEGIPDFSVCAKVTVSIENMNEIRRENFRQCDVKCAEKWSREKYKGKSGWTPSDVKQWRKENRYTWHERNDMVICDLVPTRINRFFGHLGGVSECKKCRMV